jgi:general secretion pathway protein G
MNRKARRNAFTLMEILLVLAILVVLASMVTLGYSQIQKRSYVNAAKTQLNLLESAVDAYQIDVGTLPANLDALLHAPSDLARPEKWGGPYLAKQTLPQDPWNQDYQYEVTDPANGKFRIWSPGPPGANQEISTTQ